MDGNLGSFLHGLAYVAGLILAALLGKLFLAVEKKFKFSIPVEWEQKLIGMGGILDQAIAYAEEQAHKFLKTKTGVMPDKLEVATNYVFEMVKDTPLAEMAKDKVKQLIEARLGAIRKDPAGTIPVAI